MQSKYTEMKTKLVEYGTKGMWLGYYSIAKDLGWLTPEQAYQKSLQAQRAEDRAYWSELKRLSNQSNKFGKVHADELHNYN